MMSLNSIIPLLTEMAVAQDAAAPAAGGSPSFLMQAFPFIAMIAIFYFFILRPQANKQKTLNNFLSQLKKGDEVLTSSGIFGTIEGLTDKFVTLQVADGVKIRVLRSQIHSSAKEVKE